METTLKLALFLYISVPTVMTDDKPAGTVEEESQTGGTGMEEEWVNTAILDIAYYLRSHKFNEYDRRFKTNLTGVPEYFAKFPDPPLRSLHWEVVKYCSRGFLDCLRYGIEFTGQVRINREVDTIYMIRARNWTLPKNKRKIARADEECKEFLQQDWEIAPPFPGPISRFQWRTTMSYFMCSFTLEKMFPLSVFGEPCDNYASCLWDNKTQMMSTGDPRADDSQPFACAKYSFCPDPCCPLRNITNFSQCLAVNPCPIKSKNRTCLCEGHLNKNVYALALNHWNLTCSCNEEGFVWDSRFGMCIDVNECEEQLHKCHNITETCINLRGSYECICKFGYSWSDNQTCLKIPSLAYNNLELLTREIPDSNVSKFHLNLHAESSAITASPLSPFYYYYIIYVYLLSAFELLHS